ncbi:MAG: CHRD domain-containing protein [Actinomycetota bacterium]
MKVLRFLFTTIRGIFTIVGMLVGVLAIVIAVVLFTGGPDMGEPIVLEPKGESDVVLDLGLDPLAGGEIGLVYESWLSPQQEAEEEDDVPPGAPEQFLSTEPSTDREDRDSRAHGTLAFNRELSRAYVHLEIANIDPDDINLVHIHCGRPGQLGPIMVDFGATGDVREYFADGVLSYEVTNDDIAAATQGEGIVGAVTAGCPIVRGIPGDRHRTVAGMAHIAAEGELYFNIHTVQQTFFGDIRGQLQPVPESVLEAAGISRVGLAEGLLADTATDLDRTAADARNVSTSSWLDDAQASHGYYCNILDPIAEDLRAGTTGIEES